MTQLNPKSFELTGFQRDALYVVAGLTRPSGKRIQEKLTELGMENVNHGRLYPNLDTLCEMDLVNKGSQNQRKNYYALTEQGAELLESRNEWESNRIRAD
jgi:DNA-binding PadR family transcriptional regulator